MQQDERQSTSTHTIDFSPFGKLSLENGGRKYFGRVSGLTPTNTVEVSLETGGHDVALGENIRVIRNFIEKLPDVTDRLFQFVHARFLGGKLEMSLKQLKEMYFLSALELKADGRTFWIVLEPESGVPSIHNHFLRFSIVDDQIVWSNISE